MNCDDPYKLVGNINIMELKNLIKECLREFEKEKQTTEAQYKALWKAPTYRSF